MCNSPPATPPLAPLAEYGEAVRTLRFGTGEQLAQASATRARLLGGALASGAELSCKGSKPHLGALSPGCRACVEGRWSCLFINGRCNCRCFYCPTSQAEIGVPTTNALTFPKAAEYASYVEQLGFSGASISGGEPLLTFDKTLAFVTALKRRLGDRLHVWLYTNGTLADATKLARLRDAGLDEIRFDIGATDYHLGPLQRAVGVIPTVTVEIPAIPEEAERLRGLLPELAACGVAHLNLHQLRLTPFNLPQLAKRAYTYLQDDKITVLESELCALELLDFAAARRLPLGINYCSFVFKHRFQRAAARRRAAERMVKPWEGITEAGYLRSAALVGPEEALTRVITALDGLPAADGRWQRLGETRLRLDAALLAPLASAGALGDLGLTLAYSEAALRPALSYRGPFLELRLGARQDRCRKIFIERVGRADERAFTSSELTDVVALLSGASREDGEHGEDGEDSDLDGELRALERVPSGLQTYR